MIEYKRRGVGVGTRTILVAVLALVAGFVAEIGLSQIIGIRYLPIALAVAFSGGALRVEMGTRR